MLPFINNPKTTIQISDHLKTLMDARKDLIGEIQTIIDYDNNIANTENNMAKLTWKNIRDEELVHIGELLGLIYYLEPSQKELVDKGYTEFTKRINDNL